MAGDTNTPGADQSPTPAQDQDEDTAASLSWTASEFIAHDKSAGWYLGLAAGTLLLAALSYLVTRGFVSVGVVVVAGIVMGIYASRSPRQLDYRIGQGGITVGQKTYAYDSFRSFSVVPEGAFSSIVFMPLKRFAVPLTLYFAPDNEDQIVAALSERLPFEGPRHDAVESLMRRIRF